jgi:His/Glu/Gln/Arg/opine family amino acid ABC transporter permease subunit
VTALGYILSAVSSKGTADVNFLTDWIAKFSETMIENDRYLMIFEGLGNTVKITLGALCIGVLIGLIIAVVKYLAEDSKALRPIAKLCDLYVTVIRGIPVVVLLLIFYYVIMRTSKNGVVVAIITFGVNSGAYMAELIRSGINAVDKGQMEAGRSLGLSKMQTMQKIILPQAVRYVLPAVGNEFIALLKETSVSGYVAIRDLTKAGDLIRNNTYDMVNPLMVVTVCYLVMVIGLTSLLGMVEKNLAKERK